MPADPTSSREGGGWIVDELRDIRRQLAELRSPSATQQFNAVPRLQEQIDDLLGRQSFKANSTDVLDWSAATSLTDVPFGPSLTIELERPRVVGVSFYFRAGVAVFAPSSGSTASVQVSGAVTVDGVNPGGVTEGTLSAAASYGLGTPDGNEFDSSPTARWLGTLPAGEHTFRGSLRTVLNSRAGAGSGYLFVMDPALYVDVFQTVTE